MDQAKEDILKQQYSAFLSMTAHDLLAPLRKLGVLTDRLIQKIDRKDDEEISQYTNRIHSCIGEMRSIVNSSLRIAEAIPENMLVERVNTVELINEILLERAQDIRERDVSVQLSPLPDIEGDRKQIRSLFGEIINNAIIFAKKDLPLKLEISASPLADDEKEEKGLQGSSYWKFIFKDNGIGFKKDEVERIFEPTIRLHGKSGYPGNGLGLTLVRKIVTNHRGCVFAESGEGGSRFIVLLPKTEF